MNKLRGNLIQRAHRFRSEIYHEVEKLAKEKDMSLSKLFDYMVQAILDNPKQLRLPHDVEYEKINTHKLQQMSVGNERRKVFSVRLDPTLYSKLENYCNIEGVSKTKAFHEILSNVLGNYDTTDEVGERLVDILPLDDVKPIEID